MSVTKKMLLLVLSALLGIALLAGVALTQMGRVFEAANYGNVNVVPSLVLLDDLRANFNRVRININRHVLNTDPQVMAGIEKELAHRRQAVAEDLKKYETDGCLGQSCVADATDKEHLNTVKKLYAQYDASLDPVIAESRKGAAAMARARDMLAQTGDEFEKVAGAIGEHLEYNVQVAKKAADEAVAAKSSALLMSLVIVAITLAAVGILGWVITRSLMRTLGGEPALAAAVADKLAAGDLSTRIEVNAGDTTSLMASLKQMTTVLQGLIEDMNAMSKEHDAGD
ncbi:MAG: MCP four helix bundle domain-containing protein, partial [Ignavibacteria bacterium]